MVNYKSKDPATVPNNSSLSGKIENIKKEFSKSVFKI